MSALGQKRTIFTASFYGCFAPESGHSVPGGQEGFMSTRRTFGPTGTLGDLIHPLLPALLKLFYRLQHANLIGQDVFGN